MGLIIVDIGDYKVSNNIDDTIKTFALGSCVAVLIYDKVVKIAGMIHIALPDSNVDKEKAMEKPAYFADTGLPLFIEELKIMGATRKNIWIKLVGGATIMDPNSIFDIGIRNVLEIKRILWKDQLGSIAEDIGDKISRTVSISVNNGLVNIISNGRNWYL